MKAMIVFFSGLLLLFIGSCATTPYTTPYVFLPDDTDAIHSFYVNGIPFATILTKNAEIIVSMRIVTVADEGYAAVWLLYRNTAKVPYLLVPQELAYVTALSVDHREAAEWQLNAALPSEILYDVEAEKQDKLNSQAIGAALAGLTATVSTKDTKITGPGAGGGVTVHDREEKLQAKTENIRDRSSTRMQVTTEWYEDYKNSLSHSLLRKNTVFPDQGASGYIYFLLPKYSNVSDTIYVGPGVSIPKRLRFQPDKFDYKLSGKFLGDTAEVFFRRTKGE